MAKVLQRDIEKAAFKDVALTTLAKSLLRDKNKVSLRLRAFRGRPGKTLSVAKIAWSKAGSLADASESISEVEKRVVQTWKETANEQYKLLPDPVEAAPTFCQWLEDGTAEHVKSFANEFKELRDCEDEDVVSARGRLRELVKTTRWIAESVMGDHLMSEFIPQILAGEIPCQAKQPHEPPESHTEYASSCEFLELATCAISFADHVEQCADVGRAENECLSALATSADLCLSGVQLFLGMKPTLLESGNISAGLVEWSELHTRKIRMKCASSELRGHPHLQGFLEVFQKGCFTNMIVGFLNVHVSLSTLEADGMVADAGFMSCARQREGALPEQAVEIIERARAWELCRDFVKKIEASKTFGILEILSVAQSNQKYLASSTLPGVVEKANKVSKSWSAELRRWLGLPEKFGKFAEYHEEMLNIVQAAENGDFTACPWVEVKMSTPLEKKLWCESTNFFSTT